LLALLQLQLAVNHIKKSSKSPCTASFINGELAQSDLPGLSTSSPL
jgi:hypothetical protein